MDHGNTQTLIDTYLYFLKGSEDEEMALCVNQDLAWIRLHDKAISQGIVEADVADGIILSLTQ